MSIVHPGKVQITDPSVTLQNYSDSDRTRFLYNGNQFVKARLVTSRASYAYVGTMGIYGNKTDIYTEYKDLNGNYVLVNDEKYIPQATGAPSSTDSHYIKVGFPSQVTTNEIYFWTTSYIDEDFLLVEYSYDDSTYFDISGISVSWEFVGDIQQREGESPPVGEYRYKITLGSSYTARYFRIGMCAATDTPAEVSSLTATLTVSDTTDFVDSCLDSVHYVTGVFDFSSPISYWSSWSIPFTYTGKTSSTFTGVSYSWSNAIYRATNYSGYEDITSDNWDTMQAGADITQLYSFAHVVTEIEVVRNEGPVLEIWDTDGSQAATQELEFDYYYDICFDKYNDVYITIRLNEDYDGTAGTSFDLGDTFDYSISQFDATRWTEASYYDDFQINTTSGTVENRSYEARGQITSQYYLTGDFTADIELGFNTFSGTNASVELRSVDSSYNNVFAQMGYRGPYLEADYGDWEAVQVRKTIDTTGGTAYISGLRLNTTYVVDGSSSLQFVYNATEEEWTVASGSGGTLSNITPGTTYTAGPIDRMSIVHSETPGDGVTLELSLNKQLQAAPATSPWSWRLGLEKSGDNIICRYDTGTATFVDWITYSSASTYDLKLELYSDMDDLVSGGDLTLDNFVVSGTGYWDNIPVLSVEAVNEVGNRTYVAGLTDADGYLIKRMDMVNEPFSYYSLGNGKIQLATDGLSSGFIYIKINDDLYSYAKSSLPLDLEDGSGADNSLEAVITETCEVNFAYNAYTKAGLSIIEYDDDRSGLYVNTLGTSTLSGTEYEALLDLSSEAYPFAWDINNYTTLYFVDSTSLKFFNMDESSVAFCNIAADDKIISAGSGDTTPVTATVLNVYGEPLQSKTVTFSVSAGDGAISPATDCTTASGTASSTYTVGSTVGISTVSAVASDIAC